MASKSKSKTRRPRRYKLAELFELSTGGFVFAMPDETILCFGSTAAEARMEFADLCTRE